MIEPIDAIAPETFAQFSAIIDVRSPAEYAEDRITSAINLPVLSNEERAEIGTIYVQQSRFLARRLGAAMIARNVARHLDAALADKDAKFRPLIYCWRGGMRSGAMATILSQIGWRVGVLAGGYRTWRRAVVAALIDSEAPLNLVLLDGETGAAKTAVLNRLGAHGVAAIDLEALAAHRGSVFGARPERAQPAQKMFETLLFEALRGIAPGAPIVVEAESNAIGKLRLPKRFWAAMQTAPRLFLRAPANARADYLVRAYADVISAPGALSSAIEKLRPFHAKETIESWLALASAGGTADLARALMREHYDPLYARARARQAAPVAGVIDVQALDAAGIADAAASVAGIVTALSRRSPPA